MTPIKTTAVCLLLLFSTCVFAAPTSAPANSQSWYSIELIVFRYTDPQAGSLETWPADPGIPAWNTASPLLPLPLPAAPTNKTPPAQAAAPTALQQIDGQQLDDAWNRLKHSHDYEPILHLAWTEPLADHGAAVHVRVGVPPPTPVPASNTGAPAIPAAVPAAPPAVSATTPTTPPATPTPVYGTVQFSAYGPYLHFDVDLVCQGPVAENLIHTPTAASVMPPAVTSLAPAAGATPQTVAPAFQWYRMTQDRRIESGKLNYFDNPMFGVLVLVTPLPQPSTNPATTAK